MTIVAFTGLIMLAAAGFTANNEDMGTPVCLGFGAIIILLFDLFVYLIWQLYLWI